MTQKWLLHDLSGVLADYTFAVNPNVLSSPLPARALAMHGVAIDGQIRGFGKVPPHEWTFGGILYDQAQYVALRDWVFRAGKTHLTDHLNRKFLVRLTIFNPVRAGTRRHPWRHKYEVSVTTFGGPL